MALVAIRDIQVLHARFQGLGITLLHIALEDQFAVNFELWHHAVNGIFVIGTVGRVVLIEIALLVMRRQQLRLGVDASPAVRQRQVDRRLHVQTRCFRHIAVGVDEVHRLRIQMGVERANVILIGVNIQLRFGAVGVA